MSLVKSGTSLSASMASASKPPKNPAFGNSTFTTAAKMALSNNPNNYSAQNWSASKNYEYANRSANPLGVSAKRRT